MTIEVLQNDLRACRRCVSAGFISDARPLVRGQARAPIAVIGQAPSRTDHETGNFYSGPAGNKLRAWFVEAGFDTSDFGTRIYLAAITRCFPGRLPGSSKDRVPSRAEQALCRPWLDSEFELLQPRVIVLFGGLAIGTYLSRRPLAELIGEVFESGGRILIPFPHSSGASTWLNDEENRARLARAIEQLRAVRLSLPEFRD